MLKPGPIKPRLKLLMDFFDAREYLYGRSLHQFTQALNKLKGSDYLMKKRRGIICKINETVAEFRETQFIILEDYKYLRMFLLELYLCIVDSIRIH